MILLKIRKKFIQEQKYYVIIISESNQRLNLNKEILDFGEEPEEQVHNVKTVKVEWEGRKSFMHVFTDITEIVKLGEAQNNI